jgi:glycosyltransferase involved in cell wall biosynthesis
MQITNNMGSEPIVTVYITTHNRAELLIRAIESVFLQTYSNVELIVADDGSTDDTYQRLLPMINNKQLTYVKNSIPMGACVARNLALDNANGEFITGMDDDDAMEPERVELLLKEYLMGDYSCIASSIKERTSRGDIIRKLDVGDVTLDNLLHSNLLGNQVLTRTEYLRAVGGFDPQMPAFQDYDTWVRLVDKFGVAKKSAQASYIWFTDHSYGRISESSTKRITAHKLFYNKHKHLMTERHKASSEVLRKRLTNEPFGFIDFLRLINSGNFKASISLLINKNIKPMKYLYDWVRVKLNQK